jgi:Uma2 family endonuclease
MMRRDLVTNDPGPHPRRLRFSVDDYYKMIEHGMVEDYERCEIIDGEMIQKMTIGDKHGWVVDILNRIFIKTLPDSIRVRTQNPLRISDFDEPEPDFVLADLTRYDGKRHPTPAETLIVVEVSDASLKFDRETKLPLYAEAGIPEVWIVNLQNNVVEIHREPAVGIYQTATIFRPGDTVVSGIIPELRIPVDSILG